MSRFVKVYRGGLPYSFKGVLKSLLAFELNIRLVPEDMGITLVAFGVGGEIRFSTWSRASLIITGMAGGRYVDIRISKPYKNDECPKIGCDGSCVNSNDCC